MGPLEEQAEALFDTNILIDGLKGIEKAIELLDASKSPTISLVTWMEVMAGARPEQEEATAMYLSEFTVLPITEAVAHQSARFKRDLRLKLPDAIVFATAQIAGYVLVTRNTRDFPVGMAGVRVPSHL